MPNYCIIVYPGSIDEKKKSLQMYVEMPNIKAVAKWLNAYKLKRPDYQILAAFIADSDGKYVEKVHFLRSEFKCQRWIPSYKERLLTVAVIKYGIDLKWNNDLTLAHQREGAAL